jgi:hypothetical protein
MKIEHAITECGCCIGRDSAGEFRGSWYPNPPLGDGWEMVKRPDEESARGGLKCLWRRITLPATEREQGL